MAKETRGRPKSKDPKSVIIRFRTTRMLANRIRGLAKLYAGGDMAKWLRHASVNADRKFLK